jgi:hypothetical protein
VHIRSRVIQDWWPTTASLDIVEGPIEVVAEAVHAEVSRWSRKVRVESDASKTWWDGARSTVSRFLGHNKVVPDIRVVTSWETFPSLDAAFSAAPADFPNVPSFFLILPTHSKWSVLWNNSFLCDGYDSLCFCLTENHHLTTLHWFAHDKVAANTQPGASFSHRKWANSSVVLRTVYVGQNDRRWHFEQYGPPLPEEDRGLYKAANKRDRLNEHHMAALLGRLGAYPWLEEFYALPTKPCYVLRKEGFPPSIPRRTRDEVLRAE